MGALGVAAIEAGGSLLGGLLGKGPPKPSAMVVSHIKGVMDASKRFGINPLTILGSIGGPTQGTAPPNYMGAALADAAMFAADAFLKEGDQQALQLNAYQEQNRQLQERLTHVTLNPKVPGIYGGGDGAGGGQGGVDAVQGVSGAHVPVPDPYLDIGSGTYVNGELIEPTPGWSPANVYENEYGEVGGSIMGLGKLAVDMSGEAKRALKARSDRKRKYTDNHTVGVPLAAPWGFVDRTWELLPGRTYKGKPKSSVKYDAGWIQ